MSDIKIKYGDSVFTCNDNNAPVYANRNGLQYYADIALNPEYVINNRSLPSTEHTLSVQNIKKTNRDLFYDLWNDTLSRGKYLFTIIDHKKRLLFDCFWQQWKEQFRKSRGGIYNISIDTESPYPWTPPLFAFYPFNGTNTLNDYCQDSNSNLTLSSNGSIVSNALVLTEAVSATYAARKTALSWFQKKDGSSISLLAQFRCGTIVNGSTIDIIKISDGSNTLRLYATYSADSSTSVSSVSASSLSSSSLSSSDSNSSSSLGYSSSSLESSSSRGSSASSNSSSSSSTSSLSSASSSSSSLGLSSSSSSSLSSSSSSVGSPSSMSSYSQSASSISMSSASNSSSSPSSSPSSNSSSSSSSVEGSTEMTIGFEWTKSGETPESISIDEVNNYSESVRAWYDICGTFDNVNNKFYLYVKRSGDSTKVWSYTFDYLYGTTSLTGTPENCLLSDTSPVNYPEDVTWTSLYLLQGDQANIYTVGADKSELNYAMIIDDFIPPTEFNWIRRLLHYWNKSSKVLPI